MKTFRAAALLGVLSAFAAGPVAAQTWTDAWALTNVCGGSSFMVCFSADVKYYDNVLGVLLTNNPENDGHGTITRVGVINVEDADGTVGSGVDGFGPTGDWNWETDNGLGGAGLPQSIFAWNSPSQPNGSIANGLGQGQSGFFTFAFASDITSDLLDHIGIGVHAQGYNNCSSKFGVWNIGDDGYSQNGDGSGGGSCTSVPEPTSTGLIAAGLLGLAFVSRRRGFQVETAA